MIDGWMRLQTVKYLLKLTILFVGLLMGTAVLSTLRRWL